MLVRLGLVSILVLTGGSASATSGHRHWRVYEANPDIKVSVCYPTDLLHTRRNKEYEGWIDLSGHGGATVFLNGRPEKYVSLKDQLEHALDQLPGGPRYIHESGPGLTPVHYFDIPRKKITSSIVKPEWYLYVAEDKNEVLVDYGIHVDHAIKQLSITYPRSKKAEWRGVAERMRSCFKSLGPITNPMIQ